MKKHLSKHMIHVSELEKHIDKFTEECLYCFDTESCFLNEELKYKYENKIKHEHECDAVRVYAWGLSNTSNDYVLYGEHLYQFFIACEKITNEKIKDLKKKTFNESNIKKIRKQLRMKIFVHNLAWDIEFIKYFLLKYEYKYVNSVVKNKKKVNNKYPGKSFNIIENDNIVYGAIVNLKGETLSYSKKIEGEFYKIKEDIFPILEFLDSYKILSFKLEDIAKKVIIVDEKFYKMSESYDYEKVRTYFHKLTDLEINYLYNDVYILKEFLNQFYLPLNTTSTTASGISFEKFLCGTYNGKSTYKEFLFDYPDLSYAPKIYNMIKKSYRGGWTQVNFKYKGKHLKNINGTSIDINSSYPAVIRYKSLPHGIPTLHEGYHKCNKNELNLLTIEFDSFYNKDDDNFIGEIQCGTANREIFHRLGTEYIHTNIISGECCGSNGECEECRFKLYIWEFELDNILENTVFENYKVIETLTFKAKVGHFADVVDYYTEMKIKGKKEDNNVLTNFSKLILNSFYGKLASRYERHERKVILQNGLATNQRTDVYYETERKYYPAFASCVTAWARVNLRTQLYKIGFNNVIYFDTDSLYTLLPVEEVKKRMGDMIDPYYLGKWDIEKTYSEFKAIGSKKYILKTKDNKVICRCAGLPEEVRKNQKFDDFYIGATFKGKKVKTKVKGGYVLLEGEYTLKDNIL